MAEPLELPRYRDLPVAPHLPPGSAWSVFGEDDQVGTLNLVTEGHVRSAATLVKRGKVFSLNWRLDRPSPTIMGRRQLRRTQLSAIDGPAPASDDYLDSYYPQSSSQWDALKHCGNKAHGFYNGRSADDVLGSDESTLLGIQNWAERGVAGRFVLLDLDRGLAGLAQDESVAITPDQLDLVATEQGARIEQGDIVLLRFGWVRWYEQLDAAARAELATKPMFPSPGLSPRDDTIEWLWDHGVAALGTDNPMVEVMPAAEDQLHYRLIPLLGMAIAEMLYLEALAEDCASTNVYTGLFVAAPLNLPGGSGSPANALALV